MPCRHSVNNINTHMKDDPSKAQTKLEKLQTQTFNLSNASF